MLLPERRHVAVPVCAATELLKGAMAMTYVATISHAQEEFLAYLSSWGPLGTEVSFNVGDAAADLGYCDRRTIYQVFHQLRKKGLAEMIKGDGRRLGKTIFLCFARPEDCLVDDKSRANTRGIRRPRKPKPQAPRVVMSAPVSLIPYAGHSKYERTLA